MYGYKNGHKGPHKNWYVTVLLFFESMQFPKVIFCIKTFMPYPIFTVKYVYVLPHLFHKRDSCPAHFFHKRESCPVPKVKASEL